MSLYDLFEHTQLVIVPMVDYLPIPSDPPAPDKWDFWFILKTFGPGIITALFTGTIAILAYRIAKTQREIAANKYNLDLFDKRYEIFDKIRPVYEKFKYIKFDDYKIIDNYNDVNFYKISFKENTIIENVDKFLNIKIISIKKKLKKAPRIFNNIDMLDIDKIFYILSVIENDKKELVYDILNLEEKYNHEDIRKEIKDIFQKSNKFIMSKILNNKESSIDKEGADSSALKLVENMVIVLDISGLKSEFKDACNRMNDYNEKLTEIHNNMKIIENIFTKIYKEMDNQLNISHTPY